MNCAASFQIGHPPPNSALRPQLGHQRAGRVVWAYRGLVPTQKISLRYFLHISSVRESLRPQLGPTLRKPAFTKNWLPTTQVGTMSKRVRLTNFPTLVRRADSPTLPRQLSVTRCRVPTDMYMRTETLRLCRDENQTAESIIPGASTIPPQVCAAEQQSPLQMVLYPIRFMPTRVATLTAAAFN